MELIYCDRSVLKKLVPEDYIDLFKIWSDNELIKYTYHEFTPTIEICAERALKVFNWYNSNGISFGPFLIYSNYQFVGYCGLDLKSEALMEFELHYIISREYQNLGFATEAAKKLIEIGFTELLAERIYAEVVVENTGSIRIMEKLGMKYEGCLRRKFHKGEGFHDLLVYSILKSEYFI